MFAHCMMQRKVILCSYTCAKARYSTSIVMISAEEAKE